MLDFRSISHRTKKGQKIFFYMHIYTISINQLAELASAKCFVQVNHDGVECWVAMGFISPLYESVMLLDTMSIDLVNWSRCTVSTVKQLNVTRIYISELTHKLGLAQAVVDRFKDYEVVDLRDQGEPLQQIL